VYDDGDGAVTPLTKKINVSHRVYVISASGSVIITCCVVSTAVCMVLICPAFTAALLLLSVLLVLLQSVPRFIFFKAGQEIDNFATREKEKVAQAILKHAPAGVELGDWE
jgi:hypothetical protein